MTDSVVIRPVDKGTDVWITHDRVVYYCRLNYLIDNTAGMKSLLLQQFHQRQKRYLAAFAC